MNFIVQAKTNFMGRNQHFDVFGNAHTYVTNTKYFRGERLNVGDPLAIFFEGNGTVVFGTATKVEDDETDQFGVLQLKYTVKDDEDSILTNKNWMKITIGLEYNGGGQKGVAGGDMDIVKRNL